MPVPTADDLLKYWGHRSIYWYDAVGNGSNDDTTPFRNALSDLASEGGTLFLPAGHTFRVTGNLFIAGNTHIVGHGAKIIMDGNAPSSPANAPFIACGVTSFGVTSRWTGSIRGLILQGNTTMSNSTHAALHLLECANYVLEDLLIDLTSCPSKPLGIASVTNSNLVSTTVAMDGRWRNVRVIGATGDSINIAQATDTMMDGCESNGTTRVRVEDLPTSDPGNVGELWRSGNDVKVSTG